MLSAIPDGMWDEVRSSRQSAASSIFSFFFSLFSRLLFSHPVRFVSPRHRISYVMSTRPIERETAIEGQLSASCGSQRKPPRAMEADSSTPVCKRVFSTALCDREYV
eukprot:6387584-Prymnesium_polylepis.1